MQADANRKLRDALKKQFEIQQEVLHDRLVKKENEVGTIHFDFDSNSIFQVECQNLRY